MSDASELLSKVRQDFSEVTDFAIRVSDALIGTPTTEGGKYASIIHAKMCANATSAEHQFSAPLADHSTIVAICRMIMEAMVLFFYLRESVGDDQWECRELLLRLHDTANRIKLMRGSQPESEYADLLAGRKLLEATLRENSFFKTLQEEQRKRLLTGEHFYVRGVRAAVRDSAGWNERKYFALYSYFASHAHSAPMSFFRFQHHKVSFTEPSDAQRDAASTAISVAESCLLKASLAHLNSSVECRARFDQREIAKMEAEVENWATEFGHA